MTNKKYLKPGLTASRMYRMFKEEMISRGETKYVSEQVYKKIISEDFNYHFFDPKKEK